MAPDCRQEATAMGIWREEPGAILLSGYATRIQHFAAIKIKLHFRAAQAQARILSQNQEKLGVVVESGQWGGEQAFLAISAKYSCRSCRRSAFFMINKSKCK